MTMVEMEETRRVLLGMKEELVAGWVQEALWTRDGVCLYGALVRSARLQLHTRRTTIGKVVDSYYTTDDVPAANAAACLLDEIVGGNVVLWNDKKGRTQAEVVALIDTALAVLAEKSTPAAPVAEAVSV